MGMAEIKAKARRALHGALSVQATWTSNLTGESKPLTVRWHSKQALRGELSNDGYAQILDSQDRLIFNKEELEELQVTLSRGDKILMPPLYENAELMVEEREETIGPIEEIWLSTRTR